MEVARILQFGTTLRDDVSDMALTATGEICVTGYTWGSLGADNAGHADIWVGKYTRAGETLWQSQVGTDKEDIAESIAVDADGNIYVVGHTRGTLAGEEADQNDEGGLGKLDAIVLKYDSDGVLLWHKQFGTEEDHDAFHSVDVDADGNIHVVGYTYGSLWGNNEGGREIILAALDGQGRLLSSRQFSAADETAGLAIAVGAEGHIWIGGETRASIGAENQGARDALVTLLDGDAQVLSADQFGTFSVDRIESIALDDEGGCYAAAYTQGSADGPPERVWEILLARYGSDGQRQWLIRRPAAGGLEDVGDIAVGPDGGFYLAASVREPLEGVVSQYTPANVLLAAYSQDGREQWSFQFGGEGGPHGDTPKAVAVDAEGRCYVAGTTWRSLAAENLGEADAFIVVLEPTDPR